MNDAEFKSMMAAIDLQNAEFDAGEKFSEQLAACLATPVVDDAYPEARHNYEGALRNLIDALRKNGRFKRPPSHAIGLSFSTLREANTSRLPLFKNAQGGPAHSQPDGSDWSVSDWFVAVLGELGEAANQHKKMKRDDFPASEWANEHKKLAHELADVAIYLDILAFRIGVDLGATIAEKWNKTSEKIGLPLRIDNATDTFFRNVAEGT